MPESESDYCLELSENPVRFEAVNQLTNVFFDDSNADVFAVRSGGVMGVVVKGPNEDQQPINFRMEDRGKLLSIKFSLDHKILAIQRTTNSIEFMNFSNGKLDAEYSVNCKKNASILGFVWSYTNEVAIVTDHGVELYLIIPEKKSVKQIKTLSVPVNWFVWCPTNKIALLASSHGSVLQPVAVKQCSVSKMPKVETDTGRMALDRDVTLATLYSQPAVLILRHQTGPQMAEVHIHLLNNDGKPFIKSHALRLGMSGRFAINVIDDLVLVHHQASRSSQIFDIALPDESDGNVKYHKSIAPPKSFKPTKLSLPGLVQPEMHVCELYSPTWVVFQPNIVIDAKLGCLWHIKLCLPNLCHLIKDLSLCTRLTLKRTDGRPVLLKLILDSVNQTKPPLEKLRESFNYINFIYRDWEDHVVPSVNQPTTPSSISSSKNSTRPRVLINQDMMYNEIFQKMDDIDLRKTEWVLTSYLTSLGEYGIASNSTLNEFLVRILAQQQKFTTLQQLLQYGVITDSKPIACLLLSLGDLHCSTSQLALDMLARLGASEEIQEILLSQGQILPALKLAKETADPYPYLTAAKESGDRCLFHSVLFHFRRNQQFAAAFQKDERLSQFLTHYNTLCEQECS